ncbi:MAG: VOC family protein [Anaerolineales bacterium]|nr:VOC family protein [Anaerolineales bacterium]
MSHPIVHIELSAKDHKAAGKFYSSVFGWELQEFPEMNYTTFASGKDAVGGGFNPLSKEYPAGTVMVYIHTDDLDASIEKIKANGGELVTGRYEIPTVGDMATFKDPTGNLMALLQPVEGGM